MMNRNAIVALVLLFMLGLISLPLATQAEEEVSFVYSVRRPP